MIVATKLGDVAEFIRGVTYKPADVLDADDLEAIPCMRTKNIQEDLEDADLVFIPRSSIKKEKILRSGDILVSSANSWNLVGKCSWIPELPYEATFGGFTSVLRSTSPKVLPRYLYQWFATDRIQQLARSFGQQTTNISNLNHSRCLELEIPLPCLKEQRRSVAILDKADTLRRKRKRALELLDNAIQSIFLQMFGDPLINCENFRVSELDPLLVIPPNFGSMIPPRKEVGEWLSLRVANIQNWALTLEDSKYIDLSEDALERHTLRDGDIVLARAIASAEHLGKCVVVRPAGRKWAFDSHLMRIRLNSEVIEPVYVRELFRTPGGRTIFLQSTRKTTVQYNINTKELRALKVPVPPIGLQRDFCRRVEALEAIRETMKASMEKLDRLFFSLQHRVFSEQT